MLRDLYVCRLYQHHRILQCSVSIHISYGILCVCAKCIKQSWYYNIYVLSNNTEKPHLYITFYPTMIFIFAYITFIHSILLWINVHIFGVVGLSIGNGSGIDRCDHQSTLNAILAAYQMPVMPMPRNICPNHNKTHMEEIKEIVNKMNAHNLLLISCILISYTLPWCVVTTILFIYGERGASETYLWTMLLHYHPNIQQSQYSNSFEKQIIHFFPIHSKMPLNFV